MTLHVFSSLYSQMDGMIEAHVLGGYAAVVDMVRGPLAAGIGIYMAVAGYAVMRGLAGEGWGHVLSQGVKAGLVFAAVTTGLGGVTARSVMNLPSDLSALGGGGSPGDQIDLFVGKISIKSDRIVHTAPQWHLLGNEFDDPELRAAAYLPKVAAVVLGCLVLVYVVFLKFALAVAALFGPIFVALLLFDSTRGMFFTWLGASVGYALSTIVIGITIAFIFSVCNEAADGIISTVGAGGLGETGDVAATDGAAFGLLMMTAVILVGALFLLQAQGIAQGLAGGGGGSGAMVAGAALPAALNIGRMAGARMNPLGQAGKFGSGNNGSSASGNSAGSFALRAGRTVRQAARTSQQSMRRIMGK